MRWTITRESARVRRRRPERCDISETRSFAAPFGITRYYTDKTGVYQRHLPPAQHTVGKLMMQKIERTHLTLRTRLKRFARKTLCFPRSRVMHDLLIGLYMNQVEFGRYKRELIPNWNTTLMAIINAYYQLCD
jgi:hypothetical protein